ncbi:MAG: type II toxin-antitoxin system ParD family antitoxin [Propionibacteriaceae bacterium]|jgi:putative addiction module CopG family antidote|nr:type II toxin-antitoxin system ParD family antitoxin [Propionibacteriaceae bacterium]
MRSTKQMSITLPLEMAAVVEEKVASGEYASDSEVIRDGLRALIARDRAVERWLNEVVAPTYDRVRAGQERTLTASEVRERLHAHGAAVA